MPYCLTCLGDGCHDFAEMDAYLEEHLDDEALARAKAGSRHPWGGSVVCEECEGTGVISEERWKDIFAASRAAVDQVIARVAEEEARS